MIFVSPLILTNVHAYEDNMHIHLRFKRYTYGTAQFKPEAHECITHMYFVTPVKYFF